MINTWSEEWRAECEARHYLERFPSGGRPWLLKLEAIKAKRGQAAADRLRENVRAAYIKRKADGAALAAESGTDTGVTHENAVQTLRQGP